MVEEFQVIVFLPSVVDCTKSRLEMTPERYLAMATRDNQTESL
jgi:hypothetical protein